MTTTEIDYKKLFQMFCGTDEMRPSMHTPFKQNGMYFATDAHSMIFLPIEKAELNLRDEEKIKATAVIPKETNCNIEINIADIERQLIPEMIDDFYECSTCDGEGEQECDLGHTHECSRCGGDGNLKKNNGIKIPNESTKFIMFETGFTYKQLKRFVDAVKMIGVEKITKTFGTIKAGNLFQVGDFGIIIMPYNLDERHRPIKIII